MCHFNIDLFIVYSICQILGVLHHAWFIALPYSAGIMMLNAFTSLFCWHNAQSTWHVKFLNQKKKLSYCFLLYVGNSNYHTFIERLEVYATGMGSDEIL